MNGLTYMKISAQTFVGARQGRKCVSIQKGVNGRGYRKYRLIQKTNWTLLNDKLEIFFGGRVFSAAKDAILFTMAKVAKALCTGQRH